MKTLFSSLIVLALAIWAGVALHHDAGYVLIAYADMTMEMPLWFFVIGIIVLCTALIFIIKLIHGLISAPYRLSHFYRRKKMRRARHKMREGFIALAEGDWKKAEKLLTKSTKQLPNSLLSYLGAAIAAQQQGALDRRDNYLRLAHGTNKDAEVAVSLTQARLQVEQGQLEQGLATLQLLRQLSPQHDYVLTLLKDVYTSLGEWNALLELVAKMKHRKIISEDEAKKLQVLAYTMILKNAATQSPSALEAAWHAIDRHLKHDTEIVSEYVRLLIAHHQSDVAEEVLVKQLKKYWDNNLIYQYGLIHSKDPIKQLAIAEAWLKTYQGNAILLLTLGRLSLRNKLWGKARQYFQKSADIMPTVETYLELANLALTLPEEKMDYASYVQKALQLTAP